MAEQTEQTSAPTPKPRSTICPYCGTRTRNLSRCESCRGLFDPLSRQATQNAMGPWYIRDDAQPHRPGCSYETLVRMVERDQVGPDTVLRGPSTLQFWTIARWCPGVAHLLGACHSCGQRVEPTDPACSRCGATFHVPADRQSLGLGEVRFVPGRSGDVGGLAASSAAGSTADNAPSPPQEDGAAEPNGDAVAAARIGRLGRELASARGWARVWLAGFLVLAAAGAAALVLPALDWNVGPLGDWLRDRGAARGEVGPPDLEATEPIVEPGRPSAPAHEGGREPGGDATDASPHPGGEIPAPDLESGPPSAPAGANAEPESDSGTGAAAARYRRLQRLR
jgi:hypothetical protein